MGSQKPVSLVWQTGSVHDSYPRTEGEIPVKHLEVHIVPSGTERQRLSDYLPGKLLALPSRKGTKRAIKDGWVQIDETIAHTGDWVMPGQHISLHPADVTPPRPLDIALPIIYEDEYLAAIHKPGGMPTSGSQYYTVVNALLANLEISDLPDALPWPLPVHRLDAATCGLLLVAKTKTAQIGLGEAFAQREVTKVYQAIVCGRTPEAGVIDHEIDGKTAITHFSTTDTVRSMHTDWLSALDLQPLTGRTHQLRRHLSGIGHPILGDKMYTASTLPLLRHNGLFLCATRLHFEHPCTGWMMKLETAPPPKFTAFLEKSAQRWAKFSSTDG